MMLLGPFPALSQALGTQGDKVRSLLTVQGTRAPGVLQDPLPGFHGGQCTGKSGARGLGRTRVDRKGTTRVDRKDSCGVGVRGALAEMEAQM